MSDHSNPSQNVDAARNQAHSDLRNGVGPANTTTWVPAARDSYETERAQLQKQQDEQRKQSGW